MKNLLTLFVFLFCFGSFAQEPSVGPPIGPPPEKEPLCTLMIVQPCAGSEDANNIEYIVAACGRYANAHPDVITDYLCQYGKFPSQVTVKWVDTKFKGVVEP